MRIIPEVVRPRPIWQLQGILVFGVNSRQMTSTKKSKSSKLGTRSPGKLLTGNKRSLTEMELEKFASVMTSSNVEMTLLPSSSSNNVSCLSSGRRAYVS